MTDDYAFCPENEGAVFWGNLQTSLRGSQIIKFTTTYFKKVLYFDKTLFVSGEVNLDIQNFCAIKLRQKFGGNNRNLVMGDRGDGFNRDLSCHNDAL